MKISKKILFIFIILLLISSFIYLVIADTDEIVIGETNQEFIVATPTTVEQYEDDEHKAIVGGSSLSNIAVVGEELSDYEKEETMEELTTKFASDGTAVIGVDVSHWQKDIDWQKVAESGVKFAMIKCGGRGQTLGALYTDEYFEKNIKGAIDNGIYVGIYFYSMATTEEEAIEEAEYTLNLIKGYNVKYPVAYDFEDFTDTYASSGLPFRTNGLSYEQMNKNARAFLSKIKESGYTPALYSSVSHLNNIWESNLRAEYDVWVAQYNYNRTQTSYTGTYAMWQYSRAGIIPGIDGRADISIDYTYYFKYHDIDITSFLFDATYYADRYVDLKRAYGYNEQALKNHYLNYGIKEGRSASPCFDPVYYLNKYEDLSKFYGATNYEGAYNHFINHGIKEGRQGSKYFNVNYYISKNLDIKRAYNSSKTYALMHFARFGVNEGRQGSSDFNVKDYIENSIGYYKKNLGTNYKKYIALDAGGTPIINDPINITSYLFDAKYYADKYSDLKKAYGYDEQALKNHYLNYGIKEGRSASPCFDPVYYLNKYEDLSKAYGSKNYEGAYNHFVNHGIHEGRQGSKNFNVVYYYNKYQDLAEAYGKNYSKLLMHYAKYGANEGRQGTDNS